jgi:hypothetical protein
MTTNNFSGYHLPPTCQEILVQFETIPREFPALLLIQNFLETVVEGGASALNTFVVQVHAINESLSL